MRRTLSLLVSMLLSSACSDDSSPSDDLPGDDATVQDSALGDNGRRDAAPPDSTAQDGAVKDAGSAPADASRVVDASGDAQVATLRLPPANGGLDYQLGGAYTPPNGVTIVSRDRQAAPAKGLYNICYVNGFQAQPNEADFWLNDHPTLVLRDKQNKPVIDPDWDEMLLDVSSAEKRTQLAEIVGGWIDGCAQAGYDAIEIDNLDTYSRSNGALKEDDAVAFIALLSARAHALGLAIAQKNSAEIVGRKSEMGTDFVVSEECSRYDECDVYIKAYGEHVLMIEYRRADFQSGCKAHADYSIVLRDLDLTTPGSSGYVFEGC